MDRVWICCSAQPFLAMQHQEPLPPSTYFQWDFTSASFIVSLLTALFSPICSTAVFLHPNHCEIDTFWGHSFHLLHKRGAGFHCAFSFIVPWICSAPHSFWMRVYWISDMSPGIGACAVCWQLHPCICATSLLYITDAQVDKKILQKRISEPSRILPSLPIQLSQNVYSCILPRGRT